MISSNTSIASSRDSEVGEGVASAKEDEALLMMQDVALESAIVAWTIKRATTSPTSTKQATTISQMIIHVILSIALPLR